MSELKIDLESLKSEENKSLNSMLEFFKANLAKKVEEGDDDSVACKKEIEDVKRQIENLEDEIDDLEYDKRHLEERLEELQNSSSNLVNIKANLGRVSSVLCNKLTKQNITDYLSQFSKEETQTKTILSYDDFMLLGKIQILFNLLEEDIINYHIEKTRDNYVDIYISSRCLLFKVKDIYFEGDILDPVLLDFDKYMCYRHLEKGKNVTVCRIKNDTRNQITIDDNEDTLITVFVQNDNTHSLDCVKGLPVSSTNEQVDKFFDEYESSKIDYNASYVDCLKSETDE